MQLNKKVPAFSGTTHEGTPARRINKLSQLTRSIMSCLLWEKEAYESGECIADRISALVHEIPDTEALATLAVLARTKMHLRHVPLLIVRAMAEDAKHKHLVASTLYQIIQRPDELTEFLAIYWKNGRCPVSAQVKKGLAKAFTKFNSYQLAKYNRDGAIKLRDALFICHAKPVDRDQGNVWTALVDKTLAIPDTWETSLSAGGDKKETWTRLLMENKLGGLAMLRNLRNMQEAGVAKPIIRAALAVVDVSRVLPFRFIAAARYAPDFEPELEHAMLRCVSGLPNLPGETIILADVSYSMNHPLSDKSDMRRIDAACGLAIIARDLCENCTILSFSEQCVKIPARRGFALRDAIVNSQQHGGTCLGEAVRVINSELKYDRLIVITDEQSRDAVPAPKGRGYVLNVASNKNGVGYGPWLHIDGFSENVIRYIAAYENSQFGE